MNSIKRRVHTTIGNYIYGGVESWDVNSAVIVPLYKLHTYTKE
jgi:hypothetical protein